MIGFIVDVENKPGELARIAEAVAGKGVNITGASTLAWGDRGAVGLFTSDESGTRQALDEAGCSYREVEAVTFRVADRPGTLADAARRLARAGVNIEFLAATAMPGGEHAVAAAVDNPAAAKQALGELVATAS